MIDDFEAGRMLTVGDYLRIILLKITVPSDCIVGLDFAYKAN